MWVDQAGNETVITRGTGTWVHPRLSPDGQRISMDIHSADGVRDIYIYELPRDQLRRLTKSGQTWESEWSPDGERIATLSASPAGHWSLFWIRTDFSGPAELLLRSSHIVPGCWLRDEQALLLTEFVEGEIWKLSLGEDAEPERLMGTSAWERFPRLSPDGKWIAYVKDESGRREVFVQSFPDLGPEHRISVNGGGEPVWSHDGRQIFFRERDEMLVAEIEYGPVFRASRPRVLFSGKYDGAMVGHQHYDISRDSQKFLMIKHGEPVGPNEIRVVLNWSEELKAL